MIAEGLVDAEHFYGTINCNGLSPKGALAGVTTTSGLAWKIPGRVGDSPILGQGYTWTATSGPPGPPGRGEANLYSLGSFLIIELMRNGMSPKDAGMAALKRIVANTVEKRLLNSRGSPNFNVSYYILGRSGGYAGVALYETSGKQPARFAICTEDGPRTLPDGVAFRWGAGELALSRDNSVQPQMDTDKHPSSVAALRRVDRF